MKQDEPHVKLFQAGGMTLFPLSAYESLTHALQAGDVWWEGTTVYGTTVLVRLRTVTDVHFMSAEALAEVKADEATHPWEAP
jgi:hypothetical protein